MCSVYSLLTNLVELHSLLKPTRINLARESERLDLTQPRAGWFDETEVKLVRVHAVKDHAGVSLWDDSVVEDNLFRVGSSLEEGAEEGGAGCEDWFVDGELLVAED